MPISQTDALFQLIKSLTKAEKRNFNLYARRNQADDSLKFIALFEIMDKLKECNDTVITSKLKGVSKTQYSNLKRHLYSQIVTSLRLIHKTKRANIQVREYLDFAYILYGKGLYLQALKLLNTARREAIKHHLNYLHLTIVEFEKIIETRHITRSGEQRAAELVAEATKINETISNAVYLSNLRIELHGLYLKKGHIRDEKDQAELKAYFFKKLEKTAEEELGVIEKIYLYQSYVWYAYIQLDFFSCQHYASKWVQLFIDNPEMIDRDVDLYMRGYHYILSASFHLRKKGVMEKYLQQLEVFRKANYKKLNRNSQIVSFLYVHSGRLDRIIINGNYADGLDVIPRALKRINRYKNQLDDHRILVFYFKIAWIFFGAGNIGKAIGYLNKIVNTSFVNLREDLQLYARLMFLMCHYELKNYDSLPYLIKSYQSFFKKTKESSPHQLIILNLFKTLARKPAFEHRDVMKKYMAELELLKADPFQKISFSYLDVMSWLKARITNQDMSIIVKEKLL